MSLQDMRRAAKKLTDSVKAHPITYAGGFWTSSSLALAAARGLGGTLHESIGGSIILTGELAALTLGNRWRHTYNYTATAFIAGTCVQRSGEFPSHPWVMALTLGTLAVANTPAMLEFCMKDKAQARLREFGSTGQSMLARTSSSIKRGALWCMANPRTTALTTNAIYLVTSLAKAVNEHDPHKLKYLVTFYGLMFIGNRLATLSEPRNAAPRAKALAPG